MICCYLLYSRQFQTAADALRFYGQERAHDQKGLTRFLSKILHTKFGTDD